MTSRFQFKESVKCRRRRQIIATHLPAVSMGGLWKSMVPFVKDAGVNTAAIRVF